jgi:RNA polymerase sigma factor (sigma-70 family)
VKNISIGAGLSKSNLLLEFWEYRSQFLGRIRRWVFSPETAEDIFQEACVRFITSRAVFQYPEASTKYFCRILQNLIFEQRKRSARLEFQDKLPEMVCDPQDEWNREIILDQIHEAMPRLTDRDQRLLADYLNAGQGDLKDVCRAHNLPGSTMRHRMSRIFHRLRIALGGNQ